MRVAYSGQTGQIGSQLPEDFIKFGARLEDPHKFIDSELRNIRPDCFIHLASMTDVTSCENNKTRANYLNNVCSVKYYNLMERNNVSRFIYISTSHVYQPTRSLKLLDVNSKKDPSSYYGITKLRAERNLLEAAKKNKTELIIARLFSVITPDFRRGSLSYGISKRIEEKDFSPIPGLNKVRDFLNGSEVTKALVDLTKAINPPSVVNICSGKAQSIEERVHMMFMQANEDVANIKSKDSLVDFLVGKPTSF